MSQAVSHRRKLILSVLLTPLMALLMQWAEFNGILAGPEGLGLNVLLRGPGPTSQDVFLVEITDADFAKHFGQRSPLPPDAIKTLLRRAAALEPSVMGVDVLTESPDYPESLDRELRAISRGGIVWIAAPQEVHSHPLSFGAWLAGKHPHASMRVGPVLNAPRDPEESRPPRWGVPYFPISEDLRVKVFPRHIELTGRHHDAGLRPPFTFAHEVYRQHLAHRGAPPPTGGRHANHEVLMNFSGERYRFPKISAGDLLERAAPEELRRLVKGKILLVGGTFEEGRDSYETPIGRLSGLEINAFAIQTNLGDGGIGEIARPLAVAFDLLCGYVVVFLFNYRAVHAWRPLPAGLINGLEKMLQDEARWKTVWSLAISLVGAFAFSWMMFRALDVWASYIGVFAGTIFHQIIEVIVENPGAESESHPA